MKKLLLIIVGIILSLSVSSQSPELLNYQAVLRNADGTLMANEAVTVQTGIFHESINGKPVNSKAHNTSSSSPAKNKTLPKPDRANAKYGKHERNTLDIWFADTTKVTPLAIYIHGGGFQKGSKEKLSPVVLQELLNSGISVASINYRYISNAPLPASFNDALRALQFIRSKGEIWRIDKEKIAAFGSSAGAQISMWLAFSDEMGNPDAADPVERESSRLCCVVSSSGQTTMNFDLWLKWIPGLQTIPYTNERMYGKMTEKEYSKTVEEISAMSIVSSDDPPIFMSYNMKPDAPVPPDPEAAWSWQIHHVIFGIKLKEKMDELGVEADLKYPGADSKYNSGTDFLKSKLLQCNNRTPHP